MLGSERQKLILEEIKKTETITVKKIVKDFYVSEATARRDLNELEKSGIIKRIFGGAALVQRSDKQVPLFVREHENEKEKSYICEIASHKIKNGDIIFMDGSSTCQFLIPYLADKQDIIVITNGLKIAGEVSKLHIKVFCTGGLLIENSMTFVGANTETFIDNFNADICFLSCKGVSLDGKLTDTSYEETQLRKSFIKNSKKVYFLMTKNKFDKTFIHTICSTKEIDGIYTSVPIKNFNFKNTQ